MVATTKEPVFKLSGKPIKTRWCGTCRIGFAFWPDSQEEQDDKCLKCACRLGPLAKATLEYETVEKEI